MRQPARAFPEWSSARRVSEGRPTRYEWGVTHDFDLRFAQELGNRFGSPTDSWPETAERVTPVLAIVVDALAWTTDFGGSRRPAKPTGA